MNRAFWITVLFCLTFTLMIAACDEDTITVESQGLQGVQVMGSGSAFGEPDVVVLRLGIEAERAEVQEAREVAADAMQKVISSLKDNGVAEKDIQTQQFSIQPRYDYTNQRQELRGYAVTNIVSAKVREIDKAGEVIDDVAASGGDLTRVQSITFTIDDAKELQDQARVEAMENAYDKAQTLAEMGGVTLGKPVSISESLGVSSRSYFDEAKVPSNTPIEPGQLEITVSVTVVYAIE